ncbi:MAG: hypothetical protein ABL936_01715 [Aestuariivirga sp.]
MKKTPATTPEEDYLAAAIAFQHAMDRYDHKVSNKVGEKVYDAA